MTAVYVSKETELLQPCCLKKEEDGGPEFDLEQLFGRKRRGGQNRSMIGTISPRQGRRTVVEIGKGHPGGDGIGNIAKRKKKKSTK